MLAGQSNEARAKLKGMYSLEFQKSGKALDSGKRYYARASGEEIEEADGLRTGAELTEESGQNPEDERTQFV